MGGADATERSTAARLAAAFAAADVHPLLCAVAHRTGDLSLLRDEFAPDQDQLLVPGTRPRPRAGGRGARGWPPRRCRPTWRRAGPTTT